MKKGLLSIVAAGLMTSAANAGILNLRFAGGATAITMDQASQSATIEVVMQYVAGVDKAATKVTGVNLRFDVGNLTAGYVSDTGSPDKFSVTSVSSPIAGWNTTQSLGVGGEFHRDSFFLAAGDDAGLAGVAGNNTSFSTMIASFVIHKDTFIAGDTYIVFRTESPLPAAYNGTAQWLTVWGSGSPTPDANNELDLGVGNPGKADPRFAGDLYPGNETLSALVIHNVPEPGALALLALGGLATLRRRK